MNPLDVGLKLRELRHLRGMGQDELARLSGVGVKSISSFETGQRIASLKLVQLKRILSVYGVTEAEFFGGAVDRQLAPWEVSDEERAVDKLMKDLNELPQDVRTKIIEKFVSMVDAVKLVVSV